MVWSSSSGAHQRERHLSVTWQQCWLFTCQVAWPLPSIFITSSCALCLSSTPRLCWFEGALFSVIQTLTPLYLSSSTPPHILDGRESSSPARLRCVCMGSLCRLLNSCSPAALSASLQPKIPLWWVWPCLSSEPRSLGKVIVGKLMEPVCVLLLSNSETVGRP